MSTPALPNTPAPGTRKKKGPLFWILIGVGSLVLIGCLALGVGVYFLSRVASNAGVSLDDLKNRPGIAMGRMMVATNPDWEMVKENEDDQSIVVHNKKTDKTFTLRFNQATRQLEMEDSDGNRSVIDARNGQIETESADGSTAKFGADTGEALPFWVPPYPGSSPKSNFSENGSDGKVTTFAFDTSDPADKVFDFYEKQLKDNGFTITARQAVGVVSTLAAEDSTQKRRVTVTAPGDGPVMIQTIEEK